MTEREMALRKVQMYSLVTFEAALFLDTHPNNKDALDYFKNHSKMLETAQKEYVAKFGPLKKSDLSHDATTWEWVNGPWPWEVV